MADFKEAYEILAELEGLYSDSQHDPGGKTWKGISKVHWPDWEGWKIISKAMAEHPNNWQPIAAENEELENLVMGFYKTNFWNRFQGNQLSNQNIANELLEASVNCGVHKAVSWLQSSLNLLEYHAQISVDGIFGVNTLAKLRSFLSRSSEEETHALLGLMNIYQGWHYLTLASNLDTGYKYKRFLKGWVNRRVKV